MRLTRSAPLVLGSASPRRRELLELIDVPFIVRAVDVDESPRRGEEADAYLERIVSAKLDAVRATGLAPAVAVLVADTVVVSPGGSILGKPEDDGVGQAMIESLSATTHEVHTRFSLAAVSAHAPVEHAETVTTRVTFRAIAPAEARAYVAFGEGRDKAGGYAVQGRAATFVSAIEGSYTNVVGLPLCQVVVAMRVLGWLPGAT